MNEQISKNTRKIYFMTSVKAPRTYRIKKISKFITRTAHVLNKKFEIENNSGQSRQT